MEVEKFETHETSSRLYAQVGNQSDTPETNEHHFILYQCMPSRLYNSARLERVLSCNHCVNSSRVVEFSLQKFLFLTRFTLSDFQSKRCRRLQCALLDPETGTRRQTFDRENGNPCGKESSRKNFLFANHLIVADDITFNL